MSDKPEDNNPEKPKTAETTPPAGEEKPGFLGRLMGSFSKDGEFSFINTGAGVALGGLLAVIGGGGIFSIVLGALGLLGGAYLASSIRGGSDGDKKPEDAKAAAANANQQVRASDSPTRQQTVAMNNPLSDVDNKKIGGFAPGTQGAARGLDALGRPL